MSNRPSGPPSQSSSSFESPLVPLKQSPIAPILPPSAPDNANAKCHIVESEKWNNDSSFKLKILKLIESNSGVIVVKNVRNAIECIIEFLDNKLQRTTNPNDDYLKSLADLYSNKMERYESENK